MSRMCDVMRQAVQMCGSPSHPVNDRHSTWPGAWHLRGSNLNVQHISSYFVMFQRHRTSCSHPFPAILLVPSKSFEHPQSSGLLGWSAIVRWHVVTSPCQSEGEALVRICQNWQAGSTWFHSSLATGTESSFGCQAAGKVVAMDLRTFSSALDLASGNSL